MPIEYRVDVRARCVRSRASGVISLEDLKGHIQRLAADENVPLPLHEIWDGTQVASFPLTGMQVREAVQLARQLQRTDRARLAIVSSSTVLYGLARVAQAFADEARYDIRAFRDLASAEQWLLAEAAQEALMHPL